MAFFNLRLRDAAQLVETTHFLPRRSGQPYSTRNANALFPTVTAGAFTRRPCI